MSIGLFTCSSPPLTWTASSTSQFAFPPPPPPPPPADTTPPSLRLSGARIQSALRRRAIVFDAACPHEGCIVKATGTIAIGRRAPIKLRSKTKAIAAGNHVALRLALSASAKRRIRVALRSHRTIPAKLIVVAADAAGNRTTRARTVAIRG